MRWFFLLLWLAAHAALAETVSGEVITVSRSSLFVGAGTALSLEISDALFAPLAARQFTSARAAEAAAVANERVLDAALAYLDLLQVYAELQINTETLANARHLVELTESQERAGRGAAADTARARDSVLPTTRSIVATSASGRLGSSSRTARAMLEVIDAGSTLVRATNVINPIVSCVCGM